MYVLLYITLCMIFYIDQILVCSYSTTRVTFYLLLGPIKAYNRVSHIILTLCICVEFN